MTERAELVKRAMERGYDEAQISRMTNYVLETLLSKREREPPRHHKHQHEVTAAATSAAVRLHSVERKDQEPDTQTVIDLEHVTETKNPADQKYHRFRGLAAMKHDLEASVQVNGRLVTTHRSHLDEDDVLAVQREIEQTQYQLSLVNKEMREILTWFNEVMEQKRVFYKEFVSGSSDMSGNLTSHFQKKLENIQQYMSEMQKLQQQQ